MSCVKGLLVTALAICGASASSYAAPCEDVDQGRQLDSLRAIYYSGGELPPDPSEAEIEALRKLKAAPNDPREETAFLECAFPGSEKLQAIASRDHDGDGVKDYRITASGEFRENDPDADCDGVANVLDDSPYDGVTTPGAPTCGLEPDWRRITNDQNANGLPDQIDWRVVHASGEKRAAEVQEGLYRDYKIVLVDRRVPMPAAVAVELDHAIREIFRDQVVPDFPPLRVIATDSPVCPGDDDFGWASPQTSTLYLMSDTLDLKPMLRLEVFVHEITHTLQYNLDFTAADLRGFRTANRFDSDGFHAFAWKLGWKAESDSSQVQPPYRLAVSHCSYDYPFKLTYVDRPSEDWEKDWKKFDEAKRAAHHMVSEYAFGNAWEWDAEYSAAFALNQIVGAASRVCTPGEMIALRKRLHDDIVAAGWEYNNENAFGLDAYENVIAKQFHVDDDTWSALAGLFLLSSGPNVCSE